MERDLHSRKRGKEEKPANNNDTGKNQRTRQRMRAVWTRKTIKEAVQ